jgi:hypothetical protein
MKKIFPLLICLFLTGCVTFTKPAGLEPNVSQLKNRPYKIIGQAGTKTSNFVLFWLFDVTPRANFERAVLEAVAQQNGDDLIDVSWWQEDQYWIFGTIHIIYIKGNVIKYIEENF